MRLVLWVMVGVVVGVSGYSMTPIQYHIQTDTAPDRYFRFQTYSGQFRKEKRLDDGTVFGSYGWVDANGLLRLYDYVADAKGYRIVRQRTMKVPKITEPPPITSATEAPILSHSTEPSVSDLIQATARPRVPAIPEVKPEAVAPPYDPSSQATTEDTSSASVPVTQSKHDTIRLDSRPQASPARIPTRTHNRGSTRWGNRRRRPVASPVTPSRVKRPQLLQPLRQQGSSKSDVNTGKRRTTTAQQVSSGTSDLTSSGTSQQVTGVARDPAGIDDLPAEGKFTINYDLGNQFHFEKLLPDGTKVGKHGYVDPLGILRVSHYSSGPAGHTQRQESRWVGTRHP
ncbi:uncharacterized protein [Panulirus ornatus]|uniref:uncharacterized protein n=1 Tax=Panulirus ornatus TaxID=150431 RepID=UPI003A89936B